MSPIPLLSALLFPRQSFNIPGFNLNSSPSGKAAGSKPNGECIDWQSYVANINNCQKIMADHDQAAAHQAARERTILQVCVPLGACVLFFALAWWARWLAHRRTGHYYPWLNECWRKGRCQELHSGPAMKRPASQMREVRKSGHLYRGSVGYARPVTEVFPGGMEEVDAGPYDPNKRLAPPAYGAGGPSRYGAGGLTPAHARPKSDGEMWYGVGVKDMQLPPRAYGRGSWKGY